MPGAGRTDICMLVPVSDSSNTTVPCCVYPSYPTNSSTDNVPAVSVTLGLNSPLIWPGVGLGIE